MNLKNIFVHHLSLVETTSVGEGTKIWAFSHVCKDTVIGKNCVIGEGVHIGPNVKIGDGCKIQNHSIVYEGVTLEDEVFLGPNVVTTNDLRPKAKGDWIDRFQTTLFKRGSSIGANSTVLCGVTLGRNSLVGAGSLVTSDVMENSLVVGSPARHVRFLGQGSPKEVFTNGCFDVLHYGHLKLLEYCRELSQGGRVTVGLNSDSSVKRIKGDSRPYNTEKERKFALESIQYVDEVVVFSEPTPEKVIETLRPDIIVKGGDYRPEDVVGNDLAEVKIFNTVGSYSTTNVLEGKK
jgi:UDP-2-acetamido-3-amino-2,3-dideoxy-glucuronate N-acetyltransferase